MKEETGPLGRRSTLRRVFFAPVNVAKFEELKGRTQENLIRVDLYTLR